MDTRRFITLSFLLVFRVGVSALGLMLVALALRDMWERTPVTMDLFVRYLGHTGGFVVLWITCYVMDVLEAKPLPIRKGDSHGGS